MIKRLLLFLLLPLSLNAQAPTALRSMSSTLWAGTNILQNTNLVSMTDGQVLAMIGDKIGATNIAGTFDTNQAVMSITNLNVPGTGIYDTLEATELTVGDGTGIGGTRMDARWFGAVADDDASDYTALAAAAAYVQSTGGRIGLPKGTFEFLSTGNYLDVTGSLIIEGDGSDSVLRHTNRVAATAIFTFSTGTNLTLRNLTLERANMAISMSTFPAGVSITLENVTFRDNNYSLFIRNASPTDITTYLESLLIDNCTFYNVETNAQNAALWIVSQPIKIHNIRGNKFYGGRYGAFIAFNDPPLTVNPNDWLEKAVITGNLFEGQTHDTVASVGLNLLNSHAVVENNVFRLGATNKANTTQGQAIYAYGGMSSYRNNLFDRWGSVSSNYTPTIYFKGHSIAISPNLTNTVIAGTNHHAGHSFIFENNTFMDTETGSVGCGQVRFDTDTFVIRNNTWQEYKRTNATILDYNPSGSSFVEIGNALIEGNRFIRCEAPYYFYPQEHLSNIRLDGNIWYGCNSNVTGIGVYAPAAVTTNVVFQHNIAEASPKFRAIQLSTADADNIHQNITYTDNFHRDIEMGLYGAGGSLGDAGLWTGLTFTRNQFRGASTPLWFSQYSTISNAFISDNLLENIVNPFPRMDDATMTLYNVRVESGGITRVYDSDYVARAVTGVRQLATPGATNLSGTVIANGNFKSATGWVLEPTSGTWTIDTAGDGQIYITNNPATTAYFMRELLVTSYFASQERLWGYTYDVTTNTTGFRIRLGAASKTNIIDAGVTGTVTGAIFIDNLTAVASSTTRRFYTYCNAASGELAITNVTLFPITENIALFKLPARTLASASELFTWQLNAVASEASEINVLWTDGTSWAQMMNGNVIALSSACTDLRLSGTIAYKGADTGYSVVTAMGLDPAAHTNIVTGYSQTALPDVTWATETGYLFITTTNSAAGRVTVMSGSAELRKP